LSKGTLKLLQWLSCSDLAQAGRVRFSPAAVAESTAFLEAFVPYHLGKTPRSLKFLREIR
jgi:DNA repair protein RecO (recombination protein O)